MREMRGRCEGEARKRHARGGGASETCTRERKRCDTSLSRSCNTSLSLSRASPSQHLSLRVLVSYMLRLISHVCYARLLAGAPDEADDLWATCTHPWCHAWRHVFHGGCSASPSGMLLDVLAADCQQLHTCLHRLVGMRSKYCTRRGLADVWAYRIRARAQYLVVRARD